jgi:hypothetical protein
MNLKRIRDDLGHFFGDRFIAGSQEQLELGRLLEALDQKDTALRRQLAQEMEPARRRHLEIELAVTRLQRSKGLAKHRELQRRGD